MKLIYRERGERERVARSFGKGKGREMAKKSMLFSPHTEISHEQDDESREKHASRSPSVDIRLANPLVEACMN